MHKRWQSITQIIRRSLRLKIIGMAIVPVIIVQIMIGIVVFVAYSRLTTQLVLNRDRELVRMAADQMAAQLAEDVEHLAQQGFTLNVLLGAPTTITKTMPPPLEIQRAGGTFILDAAGIVLATRPEHPEIIGQDWSTRSYVIEAARSLTPVFSNLTSDGFQGEEVILIAVPILNYARELQGITLDMLPLGTATDGAELYERMAQTLWSSEGNAIYLVDGNGRVIYHSDATYIGQDLAADPVVQRVLAGEEDAFRTTNRLGRRTITAFAPITGTAWGLIVEDDWATITHGTRGYQAALFVLLVLGGGAPALLVTRGLKRIVAPIEALTAAAQDVATGDFDQTIAVKTGDEIEALANQFNQMSARLRESYTHLEQRVTERTAELAVAKEEAEKAQKAAEAANRAKSVFLANMSHELRTPLNAILGYSQLMARDPHVTATQQEYLATIGRSGEHLLGLINDVLTMSKIEAGRTTLQENAFDLHRQLEGLREMFAMRAADKGLALLLDIAPDVPRYIEADEGKLRQVLMNLLSNAVKFTEEGGVTLRVGRLQGAGEQGSGGETLTFEVEDTGAGIASEEMASLFQAFVQTAAGQKSQEGTGLGLPISRQFVSLMGGELSVHSEIGQGSVFRFAIPVKLAEADAVAGNGAQPKRRVIGIEPGQRAPDGGPFRLLIVEDQAANRDVLVKLLTPFGFEVQCAVNGKEGIVYWEQWQPHLVWMDIRMPVMDGYEATRQIKAQAQAQGRPVVVVALTASAFEEDRAAILGAGCDDFVRKPFRENDIFDVLTRHLGVRFTYEEETPAAAVSETPTADHRAAFHALPAAWRRDFQQALTELDANQMAELVTQIQASAPALADAIRQWLRDFEYEKIMQVSGNE